MTDGSVADTGASTTPEAGPLARCTSVIADSVADFSGTQGQDSWFYGYYAEPSFGSADFLPLPIHEYVPQLNEAIWRYGDQAWTWIGATGQHPHGATTSGAGKLVINHHAVRRWVSASTEPLFIQGSIRALDASVTGVIGRVLLENSEVWQQVVAPGQGVPISFGLSLEVRAGESINFTIDPLDGNDVRDATEFKAQICR